MCTYFEDVVEISRNIAEMRWWRAGFSYCILSWQLNVIQGSHSTLLMTVVYIACEQKWYECLHFEGVLGNIRNWSGIVVVEAGLERSKGRGAAAPRRGECYAVCEFF